MHPPNSSLSISIRSQFPNTRWRHRRKIRHNCKWLWWPESWTTNSKWNRRRDDTFGSPTSIFLIRILRHHASRVSQRYLFYLYERSEFPQTFIERNFSAPCRFLLRRVRSEWGYNVFAVSVAEIQKGTLIVWLSWRRNGVRARRNSGYMMTPYPFPSYDVLDMDLYLLAREWIHVV